MPLPPDIEALVEVDLGRPSGVLHQILSRSQYFSDHRRLTLTFDPVTFSMSLMSRGRGRVIRPFCEPVTLIKNKRTFTLPWHVTIHLPPIAREVVTVDIVTMETVAIETVARETLSSETVAIETVAIQEL